VVAYRTTASLPVAGRATNHAAVPLPRRQLASVPGTSAPEDPVLQALLAATARTWPRSPTLGTLIDTWA
jgi:hypothetical protein